MEVLHLLLHHIYELLHSHLVLWVVLIRYLIVGHLIDADLIDAPLSALVLEGCVDARPIYIKKVKGVLLVKVGSPFAF